MTKLYKRQFLQSTPNKNLLPIPFQNDCVRNLDIRFNYKNILKVSPILGL